MFNDDEPLNVDWEQKKGFDKNEKNSRRIDVKKALTAEVKDRNNFKQTAKQVKNLPPNLKKLKTKIRDVYDEDDEDEEENSTVVFDFAIENENSSLLSALKDEEKAKLEVKQTLDNQKMQQAAGKMEAILAANRTSKQLGLKGIKGKIINENMQSIAQGAETFEQVLQQTISDKTKIKTQKLSKAETQNLVKGIGKLQDASLSQKDFSKNLTDMKTDDLIKIGKAKTVKETAEIILEKSGRKEPKKAEKRIKNLQKQKNRKNVNDRSRE